ncbi:mitochondrial processing peptidase [Vararia minispora EC-137]|uniref:Mitochondrial processing peptidase n=1 Tax=Vararia minispora EC-137 TaxID=1314806 RepID=A0ACB8QQ36_9AGAM|nr:mitochondrial processing peptidase [Vararia minispora EC-137]
MSRLPYGTLRNSIKASARRASTAPVNPVQVTTLPNKLRVATEQTPGHFSSVGLYVDTGSRFETQTTMGVSHFLDRMAFQSTSKRSSEEMAAAINSLGGQIQSTASRETVMYQSTHFAHSTPLAVDLIADTVQNARFQEEELEAQRGAASYELREVSSKPELILPEILHEVAYNGQGLGNPVLCPEDRINYVDAGLMRKFMRQWYRPERMVLAAVGVPHEELVELADKHFSSLTPTPTAEVSQPLISRNNSVQRVPPHLLGTSTSSPSMLQSLTRAASSFLGTNSSIPNMTSSGYTGGYRFIHDPESPMDHVYIGFEGVGIMDEDVYDLATMQVLLGGGGSFSAGGPGKGMYSRLYTHILNHHSLVDHCASFNHIYADSSLFGLFVSYFQEGRKNGAPYILPHLVHQLSLLVYRLTPETELNRAKNQLKSILVMALESRAVEVEDLGRQQLAQGRKVPIEEMMVKIDAVTSHSLQRVANRVFGPQGSKPTIVAMGREDVGDWKTTFKKYDVGNLA